MRLTLRTLLAYLDDVLEPNAAREIGAKLGESPVAASLVERIKDILKRRRIGTPEVSGPGSKPNANLVGEYLDNTLVGQDVEEIERICLESDVHLAEVAACHKILTLVLGEPVEVSRATRERMYALGAVMPSEQAAGSAAAAQNGSSTPATLSQSTTLPPELARQRSWGTLLIAALVLVVFGAWIGLVINDHGLLNFAGIGNSEADNTLAVNNENNSFPETISDAAADDDATANDEGVATEIEEIDINIPTAEDESSDATETLTDDVINPPPPGDAPEEGAVGEVEMVGEGASEVAVTEVPEATTPENTATDAPAVDETTGEAVAVVPGDVEPAPIAPASPVQMLYASHEGALLHFLTEADPPGWYLLARNSVIRDGQSIACPEPFEAQMQMVGAICRIDLVGGTRLRSLGSPALNSFELELERGGMVIRHTGGPDDPPANCGLHVAGQLMQFTLQPGSILGVQVERMPVTGREVDAVPVPITQMTAFIPQGSCVLTDANGNALDLAPEVNGLLTWQSTTGVFTPQALQAVPTWYSSIGVRTAAARQIARRYEEMFLVGQSVETTIPTIVRHDEPRFSEFAVETLGLIGDYPQLARALESEKEAAILAAAKELSQWLPLDPNNGVLLHDELARNVREMADVEVLETLLWGYDIADAQRPDVSETLVEWLLHSNLAVRILAFEHIRGFTGVTQNYQPNAPQRHLEISTDNWREYLRRNGGSLIAP